MARIQILELPTEHHGADMVTPFALIIDQAGPSLVDETGLLRQGLQQNLRDQLGARAVLVFEDTIDIPANEVPVDPDGYPVRVHVEGDFEKFREQVQEEIAKAQAEVADALRQGLR